MKEFKCRCSAIGQIMTNDRSGKAMGKTAQTYCETWIKEQLYNSKKEFSTKHTQKGNECEDNSIDFIADYFALGMLMKNDQYFENDFLTGTPDIVLPEHIIDVKNSWDCFTFPLFDTEIPTKDYEWQLQGYMWLTGRINAKLIYVLSDTPAHLIEKEAYYWCKANGYDELDMDIYQKFAERMTYKDTPADLKIKVFAFARDDEKIAQIQERVLMCREYIKGLLTKINK